MKKEHVRLIGYLALILLGVVVAIFALIKGDMVLFATGVGLITGNTVAASHIQSEQPALKYGEK